MNTFKVRTQRGIRLRKPNAMNIGMKDLPTIEMVEFRESYVEFHLSDKRLISIPVSWVPELRNLDDAGRLYYTISGHYVFWSDVGVVVGVKDLLTGRIAPIMHKADLDKLQHQARLTFHQYKGK